MARATSPPSPSAPRRRRADAERSITAILTAAIDTLATEPDASMAEIARRADVVRATIYMHFPTRDSLLDAVMDHAIADVTAALAATEPAKGEPREALERLLTACWHKLDQLHSIIAINSARLPAEEFHRRHLPVIALIAPLIERGQKKGAFRRGVPASWHLSMMLAIVHTASGELRSGRIASAEVEAALLTTVLSALS
jgi:AcrR family transcriptional regulator